MIIKLQILMTYKKFIHIITSVSTSFTILNLITILFHNHLKLSRINLIILPITDPLTAIIYRVQCSSDILIPGGCSYPIRNVIISILTSCLLSTTIFTLIKLASVLINNKYFLIRFTFLLLVVSSFNIIYLFFNLLIIIRHASFITNW